MRKSTIVLERRGSLSGAGEALHELRQSLASVPPEISSKFFYDDTGAELFRQICELPEYYVYRAERSLLQSVAAEIAEQTGAEMLIELGSGDGSKTRLLLGALRSRNSRITYVAFDLSRGTIEQLAEKLAREYDGLDVHVIVGDFLKELAPLPAGRERLVAFLGGTIGNLRPEEGIAFLRRLGAEMSPGEHFLLGVDLIKEKSTLEMAYNDEAGVTAEFNRNILRVVNSIAGAEFDPLLFRHRAFYDEALERVEMRLVSTQRQRIGLGQLGGSLRLAAGDEIRTEISAKYQREKVQNLLEGAGFALISWYTSEHEEVGLALSRRV